MREDDSNWFSKWEEQLPSPEELMPLSQTLITPDLASAFDIRSPGSGRGGPNTPILLFHPHQQPQTTQQNSPELDSSSVEFCGVGGGGVVSGTDEPARTLKRPRLVWTPQLHKRFVDAVAHLGIKNAVPKTIMQLMSVDGLTRENVASHLQKYRLYLKRMQGINTGGTGGGNGSAGSDDPVSDRLFASLPVPAHFLHQSTAVGAGGGGYMQMAGLHHQQQMGAVAVAGHHQIPGQYNHHQRQMGHFGQFDHAFLARYGQLGSNRNGMLQGNSGFVEDLELGMGNNGRKALTLFPSADD